LLLYFPILLLASAVFFEELIEQHRVDLLIANGFGFAFRIAAQEIGIHFGYFLRDQTKGDSPYDSGSSPA
jgi:hypothetical protein